MQTMALREYFDSHIERAGKCKQKKLVITAFFVKEGLLQGGTYTTPAGQSINETFNGWSINYPNGLDVLTLPNGEVKWRDHEYVEGTSFASLYNTIMSNGYEPISLDVETGTYCPIERAHFLIQDDSNDMACNFLTVDETFKLPGDPKSHGFIPKGMILIETERGIAILTEQQFMDKITPIEPETLRFVRIEKLKHLHLRS